MTTQNNLFKQAHAIAKVLEGSYSARIKLAFLLIKEGRTSDVDTLVTVEPIQTIKAVEPTKPVKKVAPVKQAKASKVAKVAKEVEEVAPIVYTGLPSIIVDTYTVEQCTTLDTIISNFVTDSNKLSGEHLEAKKFQFEDGMEQLGMVQDFQGLQSTMVNFFLEKLVRQMAWKYIEMGAGYKSLNMKTEEQTRQQMSYQNAPSSSGKIIELEIDDIYSELKIRSLERVIDESMFDDITYTCSALKFAISNSLRTALRRSKKLQRVNGEKMDDNGYMSYIQDEEVKSVEVDAFKIAKDMGVFTEIELFVLELSLDGFTKVEIDRIIEKRSDRTFQSIKKKYRKALQEESQTA